MKIQPKWTGRSKIQPFLELIFQGFTQRDLEIERRRIPDLSEPTGKKETQMMMTRLLGLVHIFNTTIHLLLALFLSFMIILKTLELLKRDLLIQETECARFLGQDNI